MSPHPDASPLREAPGSNAHKPAAPAVTAQERDALAENALYDVEAGYPAGAQIDTSGMAAEDLRQIAELMSALAELRQAERRLSAVSQRYMQLNETDMRALQYLIVCANRGAIATPGGIAHHLGISSASTTKLLDRLEKGGHVLRGPHPTDRRALEIRIAEETRSVAMDTVGRQHAKRFHAAARLTAAEREIVIGFLQDMTREITLTDEPWARS